MRHVVRKSQRIQHAILDSNYGADTCAVPDLSPDILEMEKQHIICEVEQSNDRYVIEKETKEQYNSNDWMKIRRMMLPSSNFWKDI